MPPVTNLNLTAIKIPSVSPVAAPGIGPSFSETGTMNPVHNELPPAANVDVQVDTAVELPTIDGQDAFQMNDAGRFEGELSQFAQKPPIVARTLDEEVKPLLPVLENKPLPLVETGPRGWLSKVTRSLSDKLGKRRWEKKLTESSKEMLSAYPDLAASFRKYRWSAEQVNRVIANEQELLRKYPKVVDLQERRFHQIIELMNLLHTATTLNREQESDILAILMRNTQYGSLAIENLSYLLQAFEQNGSFSDEQIKGLIILTLDSYQTISKPQRYIYLAGAVLALKEHDTYTGDEQYQLLTDGIHSWSRRDLYFLGHLRVLLTAFKKYDRFTRWQQLKLLDSFVKQDCDVQSSNRFIEWGPILNYFSCHEEYTAESVFSLMELAIRQLHPYLEQVFDDIPKALDALSGINHLDPASQMELLTLIVLGKNRYGARNLPKLLDAFHQHAGFRDEQILTWMRLYIADRHEVQSTQSYFLDLAEVIKDFDRHKLYTIPQQEELLNFLFSTCKGNCQRVLLHLPKSIQALQEHDLLNAQEQLGFLSFIASMTHPSPSKQEKRRDKKGSYIFPSIHAYQSLPHALRALDQEAEISKQQHVELLKWIATYAEENAGFAYRDLPDALQALKEHTDFTPQQRLEFLKFLSYHAKNQTGEVFRALPKVFKDLKQYSSFNTGEQLRLISFIVMQKGMRLDYVLTKLHILLSACMDLPFTSEACIELLQGIIQQTTEQTKKNRTTVYEQVVFAVDLYKRAYHEKGQLYDALMKWAHKMNADVIEAFADQYSERKILMTIPPEYLPLHLDLYLEISSHEMEALKIVKALIRNLGSPLLPFDLKTKRDLREFIRLAHSFDPFLFQYYNEGTPEFSRELAVNISGVMSVLNEVPNGLKYLIRSVTQTLKEAIIECSGQTNVEAVLDALFASLIDESIRGGRISQSFCDKIFSALSLKYQEWYSEKLLHKDPPYQIKEHNQKYREITERFAMLYKQNKASSDLSDLQSGNVGALSLDEDLSGELSIVK